MAVKEELKAENAEGVIKDAGALKGVVADAEGDKSSVEKTPQVQELCKLNDEYVAIEKEWNLAFEKLRKEFTARQQPLLEKRTQNLQEKPIAKFWVTAMQNVPALADEIAEHDLPVLEHLVNITTEDLPDESGLNQKGFKVTFEFSENKYFENKTLTRIYHTVRESDYLIDQNIDYVEMEEDIKWKEGMDVTVEKVAPKKRKGGGAKKKEKAAKLEPRPSFFRSFFRTINPETQDPEELEDLIKFACEDEIDEEDEPNEILQMIMDDALTQGQVIKDTLIPFAVAWYTGEAMPEQDEDEDEDDFDEDLDEDEDDDDEDDDDDDESDDDDEDDEAGEQKKKDLFKAGKAGKQNKEECKQQ